MGLDGDSLARFVASAAAFYPKLTPPVACFYAVRDLPYAIDAAHNGPTLLLQRRGDCLAKAALLTTLFEVVGVPARRVTWTYDLPDVLPEVGRLPSRLDLHHALEAMVDDAWVLVDATHDPGLHQTALTVAEWDGVHPTQPNYPPTGRRLVDGVDDDERDAVHAAIRAWTTRCDPDLLSSYRSAYISWLATKRVDLG